jgi:ABC-2 type transport system permease protein
MSRTAGPLRAFGAAVRLGWEISSNWTRPGLFVVYSLLRPVSGALILVVMYSVVTGSRAGFSRLPFLVVGVAFWGFVQNGLAEYNVAVADDRGHYRTLKYIYMAPYRFSIYLLGRGLSQLINAAASVIIVLGTATLFLHLPIDPARINWPLLVVSCLIAFVAITSIASAFALTMLAVRESHAYGEIAAQVLYVFSGAIFPVSVLPGVVAAIASLSPLVYWMELLRRSLLRSPGYSPAAAHVLMFPGLTDGAVFLRLVVATAGAVLLAIAVYRWADRRARRLGLIDREMNW